MKKVFIVTNQTTKKLDIINALTFQPIHQGYESVEDAKSKLGDKLLVGGMMQHPYLGRLKEARLAE